MLTRFFTGRINRKQYICYYAATAVVASLLIVSITLMAGLMDPAGIANIEEAGTPYSIDIPAYIVSILTMAFGFSFDIRRFHDLNRPTSWAVVPLVLGALHLLPVFEEMNTATYILCAVQIVIFLYLCFARGTQGENEYGMQP